MATVVTVHGTFAHEGSGGVTTESAAARQWWQAGSELEADLRRLVEASTGETAVTLEPFEWSGANSETGRREAGGRLFARLKQLEAKGEPYCVVGHSHGGSVLGWALLESAGRRQRLPGLRRWITVGTPFVALDKERLLFQRLGLMSKVVFVASLMLLIMFLVYMIAELAGGGRRLFGGFFPGVTVVQAVMMSLPMVVFYLVFKYLDGLHLLHYRRAVRARARDYFGARWLSLTHEEDEAVQGLAFLPGAKLAFFDREFAVPAITTLSVVALPLIYLLVLLSPPTMLAIGDWMKSAIYQQRASPEAEQALRDMRARMRQVREAQRAAPGAEANQRAAWQAVRQQRRELAQRYPDLDDAERALRFKQRFFERAGKPCEGGQLCGGGHDLRINSGLLLHLVTDEVSALLAGDTADTWWERSIWQLVVPVVIVPVLFGLLSLLLMVVIGLVARVLSDGLSRLLNMATNAEVRRAAFGNDTEGETATGARDRPAWIDRSPPRLPAALGALVTGYSNGIASQSLSKFRRVIGQLASTEPQHSADTAITTYFTWKELVHSSYFDVPQFRKLVLQALSRAEGFQPTAAFRADADHATTAQWLAQIEGAPGTTTAPGEQPPTASDAEAVSAVVASTVKAEP